MSAVCLIEAGSATLVWAVRLTQAALPRAELATLSAEPKQGPLTRAALPTLYAGRPTRGLLTQAHCPVNPGMGR